MRAHILQQVHSMFSSFFLLHLNIVTWEDLVRFAYSIWIMWFMLSYANIQWQNSTLCLPQGSHSQWTIQTSNTYGFKGKCTYTCILNKLKECNLKGKWSPIFFLKQELVLVFACEHHEPKTPFTLFFSVTICIKMTLVQHN